MTISTLLYGEDEIAGGVPRRPRTNARDPSRSRSACRGPKSRFRDRKRGSARRCPPPSFPAKALRLRPDGPDGQDDVLKADSVRLRAHGEWRSREIAIHNEVRTPSPNDISRSIGCDLRIDVFVGNRVGGLLRRSRSRRRWSRRRIASGFRCRSRRPDRRPRRSSRRKFQRRLWLQASLKVRRSHCQRATLARPRNRVAASQRALQNRLTAPVSPMRRLLWLSFQLSNKSPSASGPAR